MIFVSLCRAVVCTAPATPAMGRSVLDKRCCRHEFRPLHPTPAILQRAPSLQPSPPPRLSSAILHLHPQDLTPFCGGGLGAAPPCGCSRGEGCSSRPASRPSCTRRSRPKDAQGGDRRSRVGPAAPPRARRCGRRWFCLCFHKVPYFCALFSLG